MIEMSIVEFIMRDLLVILIGILLCIFMIIGICSEITRMRYNKKLARGQEIMNGPCNIARYDTALVGATYSVKFVAMEFTQEKLDEIRELFSTYLDATAAVFYGELDGYQNLLYKRNLSDKKEAFICEKKEECERFLSFLAFMRDHGIDAYLNYLQNFKYIGPCYCEEEKIDNSADKCNDEEK